MESLIMVAMSGLFGAAAYVLAEGIDEHSPLQIAWGALLIFNLILGMVLCSFNAIMNRSMAKDLVAAETRIKDLERELSQAREVNPEEK
jgi:hypothetical protein